MEYLEWLDAFERLDDRDRATIRRRIEELDAFPLISVLMPVYETPEPWLRKAIDSVRFQIYPRWELCIADDASSSPHVRKVLEEYAQVDSRIHVVWRAENGHISRCSNSALALAKGTWVALLDHDDELAEEALYLVAELILRNPEIRLIYSDQDVIDANGKRSDPYFKPDFSYDLLLSQNYIFHLDVYHAGLMRELGGFRPAFDGSQDHDLALRFVERIRPEQIRHIPRILYHWRKIPGSVAMDVEGKPYALPSARRAIADHLARTGVEAEVGPSPIGSWHRIRRKLSSRPLVTILIPTRNRLELLRPCLESIRHQTRYSPYEILVIDNDSDDPETIAFLEDSERCGRLRVRKDPSPFHYSGMHNRAVPDAKGEILVFLNNDTEVFAPDWLEELVSHAVRPEVGAVGARLLYPDGSIQHAGIVLGLYGMAGHLFRGISKQDPGYVGQAVLTRNVSAVTGACLATRKTLYQEVGGFEERLPIACQDVDYCLKLREKGYLIVYTPFAELLHRELSSRGPDDTPEKRPRAEQEAAWMRARWGKALSEDPYYNLNLTLRSEDCSLACPPRGRNPWYGEGDQACGWVRLEEEFHHRGRLIRDLREELRRATEQMLRKSEEMQEVQAILGKVQAILGRLETELRQIYRQPFRSALRLYEKKIRSVRKRLFSSSADNDGAKTQQRS
ncbi:O-antigen biosynthesis protein [Methylacidimicrobium cyclopophantes]|uniref:O-antigen biosynthesis protein n=1 Tax=Methylacidimicrobium cyclopophantes TaxID=1041766 RepID=A0A5E6MGN1_9BACT|nr:glycosyltransferase family 2 protein [Methylacidimicrobium cyclopophantes]VVM07033.1 O-antigen biosynthesis protein [Methylacidimicrobium cyclopophantes]